MSTPTSTSARPASLRPGAARRPPLALTAALAAAGLLLAGCGSDDGGGGDASPAPGPTVTSAAPSPEPTTSGPEPSGSAEPTPSAPADPGVGAGCPATGGGVPEGDGVLHLAGLLATEEGDGWTVTRTLVDLDPSGEVATNGAAEVVAEGAAATDAVVTTAQEVSCGDLVAGDGGLVEPSA